MKFDVSKSFVVRGNSIEQNGLLFKPVIRGDEGIGNRDIGSSAGT